MAWVVLSRAGRVGRLGRVGRRGRPGAWLWPTAVPLTFRRALPDVLRIVVARVWGAPVTVAALAAAAGWIGWSAAASLALAALLTAVEETAHLAVAARLAPGAPVALVARPGLRFAARVPALPRPADVAAVALAGPLAAALAGALAVTLPLCAGAVLRDGARALYHPPAPALVPAWLALSALPLRGSDAAAARDALRAVGPGARLAACRRAARLAVAVLADRRWPGGGRMP